MASVASTLENEVAELKSDALRSIKSAGVSDELEALRVGLLGKSGRITQLLKLMKNVPAAEKKSAGSLVNSLKIEIDQALQTRKRELDQTALRSQLSADWIDVTLPVNVPLAPLPTASIHPLTRVQRELERVFTGLGFTVVDGPEVEREYYNFDALNIPEQHPARDMQDTFWTKDGDVLRTHTSCIQARSLEQMKPPLRIVAPGRCFRYERIDASHEHTFYQMEGMMVDKKVSISHLIYFMRTLLREIFGSEQKIRLRPGYFPFVEPGFELDIWFQNRWMELLPCGLVHPRVLEVGGINPKEWQGFAFGLGLSRLVMSRFGITDIRYLQGGDLRFLSQFA